MRLNCPAHRVPQLPTEQVPRSAKTSGERGSTLAINAAPKFGLAPDIDAVTMIGRVNRQRRHRQPQENEQPGDRDGNSLMNDVSVSGFPDDLGPAVERR